MIYYFSGTGNSKFVADELAYLLHDELRSLNQKIKDKEYLAEGNQKALVIVFPVYAGRIPKVVQEWMLKTSFPENDRVYYIGTCSHIAGDIEKHLKKLSERAGLSYCGFREVYMPQNHITLYDAPDETMEDELLHQAMIDTRKIATDIESGNVLPQKKRGFQDWLLSDVEYYPFYSFFLGAKAFRATDTCMGCGHCEKVCPLSNIKMNNKIPSWGKNCTHCMACISQCPKEAIEYGEKTTGKRRNQCRTFCPKLLKGDEL